MKIFNKLFAAVLFCFAFVVTGHAQQIDPSYQINWPTSCNTTGSPYVPHSNACIAPLWVVTNPTGTQTVTQPSVSQPLAINYLSEAFVNGIPQADQFCGLGTIGGITTPACSADMCVKLRAADQYAVNNGINQVDATHFSGVQACSVDPVINLITPANYANVNLSVKLGAVHIQSAVEWNITNSGLNLRGLGPAQTQLEYVNSTSVLAVLKVGLGGVITLSSDVSGIFVYGGNANATYGMLTEDVAHSHYEDIFTWGASTCGFQTWGDVTDTFVNVRTSYADFVLLGAGGTHTTPGDGICTDIDPNTPFYQTTNSTFVDVAAEGVTNYGWHIENAQTLTFSSGTSEGNGYGIYVSAANSKFNTFIGSDLESNTANVTGVDVNDQGNLNTYINLLASSGCTSPCTNSVYLYGSGQHFLLGGYQATGSTGAGLNGIAPIAFTTTTGPTGGSATALPSQPVGYWIIQIKGVNVKIPYYN